ncbi:MAG: hypothetical protein PHS96_13980 [Anaerolineales bacterium]|nr:hypothetical protein [Anaerolineales bacterium]
MKAPPALGPRIALYRDRQLTWRDLPGLFAPGSLAILAPVVAGLDALLGGYAKYGPAFALDRSLPWFLLALLAAAIFIGLLAYRWVISHRFVAVHQNGILLALNPRCAYLWPQLFGIAVGASRSFLSGRTGKLTFRARLHPLHGKPIQLPGSLDNMAELLTRCKARLYPTLLPAAIARFKAGERVDFGPLSLHPRALHCHGRALAWEQVMGVTVQSGRLVIELASQRPMRIPVAQIPNVELLLQVARLAMPAHHHPSQIAEGTQHL